MWGRGVYKTLPYELENLPNHTELPGLNRIPTSLHIWGTLPGKLFYFYYFFKFCYGYLYPKPSVLIHETLLSGLNKCKLFWLKKTDLSLLRQIQRFWQKWVPLMQITTNLNKYLKCCNVVKYSDAMLCKFLSDRRGELWKLTCAFTKFLFSKLAL